MKVIQTFYPAQSGLGLAYKSSYVSAEFHWMAWALSCITLSKFYDVELYTNTEGKDLLINKLNLPYCKVHTVLDDYSPIHTDLWAMPKVYTYSLQNEPFIHVDGDIFVWQEFPADFLESGLLAQHKERDTGKYYQKIYDLMLENNFKIPDFLVDQFRKYGEIICHNAGIIGGNDTEFFKFYAKEAFAMLQDNKEIIEQVPVGMLNVIAEQYIYSTLAEQSGKHIESLLDTSDDEMGSLEQLPDGHLSDFHFADFLGVPYQTSFIHMLGFKSLLDSCLMLAKRLRYENQEIYSKILQLCKEHDILTSIVDVDDSLSLHMSNDGTISKASRFIQSNQTQEIVFDKANPVSEKKIESIYQDILKYESIIEKFRISHNDKWLLEALIVDKTQFELIEKKFGNREELEKTMFVINNQICSTYTYDNWTSNKIIDNSYNFPNQIVLTKIVLIMDPLTKSVREIFCDEFISMLINFTQKPIYFLELKNLIIGAFSASEAIDDPEDINADEFDYFIGEQLRQCVFIGLVRIKD